MSYSNLLHNPEEICEYVPGDSGEIDGIIYSDEYFEVNGKSMHARIYQPKGNSKLHGGVIIGIGISGAITRDPHAQDNLWLNDNTQGLARIIAEQGFCVVEISPSGHGESEGPYSIDDHVDAINHFAGELYGIFGENIFATGHSSGGIAAARSAAELKELGLPPYKAVALFSAPVSVKDAESMSGLYKAYQKAKQFEVENLAAKIGLIGANLYLTPRIKENQGLRHKMHNLWHLRISGAPSEFVEELFSLGLRDIKIPRETVVLNIHPKHDGSLYKKLTPQVKAQLVRDWSEIASNPIMEFCDGNHIFSEPGQPFMVFNTNEFKRMALKVARLFQSRISPQAFYN